MTRDNYIKILMENYQSNDTIAVKIIDSGDIKIFCDRNNIVLHDYEIEDVLILIDKNFDDHFKYFREVIKECIKEV